MLRSKLGVDLEGDWIGSIFKEWIRECCVRESCFERFRLQTYSIRYYLNISAGFRDPAFEHAAMSNNDLVQMNHIAVTLFRFWVQDPAIWLLQDIRDSFNKSLTAVVRQTTTSAALYCRIYSRHPTHPRLDKRSRICSLSTCSRRDFNVFLPTTFGRGRAVFSTETDVTPKQISHQDLTTRQLQCPEVQQMRSSPNPKILYASVQGFLLFGDTFTGIFPRLVPIDCRRAIFETIHNATHPGIRATRRLISSWFMWPGLGKQVTIWVRECLPCQKAKIHRHVHLKAASIPIPCRRFSHIHVDLIGPLPVSKSFTHLFTIIDRTTRWLEAIPLSSTTALDCAEALFLGWIARYGVPNTITSDRGAQFI